MATAVSTPAHEAVSTASHWTLALQTWHLLSLDAPCVAALWTVFLARCFSAPLPWSAPAALGLAVWMFYVLDRIADASRQDDVLAERHHFHHHHRSAFAGAILGAVPVLGILLVLLPPTLRMGWMLLALPLALYAVAVHVLRWPGVPKEHLVALFFALATAMPVIVRPSGPRFWIVPAMVAFGALCWLNCIAIARWERARSMDGVAFWTANNFRLALALAITLFAFLLPFQAPLAGACISGAAALLLLDVCRSSLDAVTLRALADAALLTPLLLLPFLPAR